MPHRSKVNPADVKVWLRTQLVVVEAVFPGTQWWDVRTNRWRSLKKSLAGTA